MKLFLTFHSQLEPEGYTIISPIYINGARRINAELWNLDDVVADNSCDHILVIGGLEYMGQKTVSAVQCWGRKLKEKAELTIIINNAYEIARKYALGEIDLSVFNSMLFERGKLESFDLYTTKEMCALTGLKVKNIKPNGTAIEVTLSK